MGRDSNAICMDCKVVVFLGYGSYSTWLDDRRTVAEFDAAPGFQRIPKNAAWRAFLVEHGAHYIKLWSSDWAGASIRGDRTVVVYDHDDEVLADVTGFRMLGFEDDR